MYRYTAHMYNPFVQFMYITRADVYRAHFYNICIQYIYWSYISVVVPPPNKTTLFKKKMCHIRWVAFGEREISKCIHSSGAKNLQPHWRR